MIFFFFFRERKFIEGRYKLGSSTKMDSENEIAFEA